MFDHLIWFCFHTQLSFQIWFLGFYFFWLILNHVNINPVDDETEQIFINFFFAFVRFFYAQFVFQSLRRHWIWIWFFLLTGLYSCVNRVYVIDVRECWWCGFFLLLTEKSLANPFDMMMYAHYLQMKNFSRTPEKKFQV